MLELTIPAEGAERFKHEVVFVAKMAADNLAEAEPCALGDHREKVRLAGRLVEQAEGQSGDLRLELSDALREALRQCLYTSAYDLAAEAESFDPVAVRPGLSEVTMWCELLERVERESPRRATA